MKHYKRNPQTGEYDIPCTPRENLVATARNGWISRSEEAQILARMDSLTEEESKIECRGLDELIKSRIAEWRFYCT